LRGPESENWKFFLKIPELDRRKIKLTTIRQQQVQEPLFEFSGACSGCGETPYIKLVTQLFGDRAIIANATGCSSIYGGNLPTTPYPINSHGRGPAWSNSVFEDNAEIGLGRKPALAQQSANARQHEERPHSRIGGPLTECLLGTDQSTTEGINIQRECVAALRAKLRDVHEPEVRDLLTVCDALVEKSVWIIGGDG